MQLRRFKRLKYSSVNGFFLIEFSLAIFLYIIAITSLYSLYHQCLILFEKIHYITQATNAAVQSVESKTINGLYKDTFFIKSVHHHSVLRDHLNQQIPIDVLSSTVVPTDKKNQSIVLYTLASKTG